MLHEWVGNLEPKIYHFSQSIFCPTEDASIYSFFDAPTVFTLHTLHKHNCPFCCGSNWVAPWSTVLPETLTGPRLTKKFPVFYGTRRFVTAFPGARHISWARAMQSTHPLSYFLNIHLILSSPPPTYLYVLRFVAFSQIPHRSPACLALVPHTIYMPYPSYFCWFEHLSSIRRLAQITKLVIIRLSPVLSYLEISPSRQLCSI